MKFLDYIKPVATVAKVFAKATPVGAGLSAALDIIEAVEDITEVSNEDLNRMYISIAAGFMDVSAEILRAVADGKITEDEQRKIVGDISTALSGLKQP